MTPEEVREILGREDISPDLWDAAEARTVRELGSLSRRTTPEGWDRYWARVAELVKAYI